MGMFYLVVEKISLFVYLFVVCVCVMVGILYLVILVDVVIELFVSVVFVVLCGEGCRWFDMVI